MRARPGDLHATKPFWKVKLRARVMRAVSTDQGRVGQKKGPAPEDQPMKFLGEDA
jgi:hypothetical protein